jgi:hypothetical protein
MNIIAIILMLVLWGNLPTEVKADPSLIGMSYTDFVQLDEDEFEYMAQVIEAESDRKSGCTDGKCHISATIWNRKASKSFPDSIRGVLNEAGQFTTTSGGSCAISATQGSRQAVVEGYYRIVSRDIPSNLLFFNCIGYNYGSAYDYIEGNYFMTYGKGGAYYGMEW